MLEQLIYLSEAKPGLSLIDVRSILGSSQVKNRRRDLTGLLLYSGEHFIQVLEGRSSEVSSLVSVIKRDPRHVRVKIVKRASITSRRYGSWDMGYVESLDAADEVRQLFETACDPSQKVERLLERMASEA